MNSSIDLGKIKEFIRNNVIVCLLVIVDCILFFVNVSLSHSVEETSSQMDALQLQYNYVKTQLANLNSIEKDLSTIKSLEEDIFDKCLNFGKKTSIYKFLTKINQISAEVAKSLNVTIVNSVDVTKSQQISLDQSLLDYNGDYVIVDYKMTFNGSFSTIVYFINKINEIDNFITLKSIDINEIKRPLEQASVCDVTLVYSILGKIKIKDNQDA